ncbi:hypothetical protein JAAARDRAFT_693797 [Jaapia argillacea MUCL 33604]|uniref:Uncharacterized protein n=1 Tax=Jaapia argillacea MUCL 33604 TaxID=933084 RepID=A0A067Q735_9AGAM|nr:hypothetical protein JAAARDRAFT_693797 [Jaapia argillacea MUCL 33604]
MCLTPNIGHSYLSIAIVKLCALDKTELDDRGSYWGFPYPAPSCFREYTQLASSYPQFHMTDPIEFPLAAVAIAITQLEEHLETIAEEWRSLRRRIHYLKKGLYPPPPNDHTLTSDELDLYGEHFRASVAYEYGLRFGVKQLHQKGALISILREDDPCSPTLTPDSALFTTDDLSALLETVIEETNRRLDLQSESDPLPYFLSPPTTQNSTRPAKRVAESDLPTTTSTPKRVKADFFLPPVIFAHSSPAVSDILASSPLFSSSSSTLSSDDDEDATCSDETLTPVSPSPTVTGVEGGPGCNTSVPPGRYSPSRFDTPPKNSESKHQSGWSTEISRSKSRGVFQRSRHLRDRLDTVEGNGFQSRDR